MCSNYVPVTAQDRLLTWYGVDKPQGLPEGDAFPDGVVPMVRRTQATELLPGERILDAAVWRFVPGFVAALSKAHRDGDRRLGKDWERYTYNARIEGIEGKRTYAQAWAEGRRCILPTQHYYEHRYYGTEQRPGPSERWCIQEENGAPLSIVGLYRTLTHPVTGQVVFACTMLTVNCEQHPVTSLFHRPGDEKRMPVIIDHVDHEKWLQCSAEEARAMCKPWHGPLRAFHAPRPGEAPRQQSLL